MVVRPATLIGAIFYALLFLMSAWLEARSLRLTSMRLEDGLQIVNPRHRSGVFTPFFIELPPVDQCTFHERENHRQCVILSISV